MFVLILWNISKKINQKQVRWPSLLPTVCTHDINGRQYTIEERTFITLTTELQNCDYLGVEHRQTTKDSLRFLKTLCLCRNGTKSFISFSTAHIQNIDHKNLFKVIYMDSYININPPADRSKKFHRDMKALKLSIPHFLLSNCPLPGPPFFGPLDISPLYTKYLAI